MGEGVILVEGQTEFVFVREVLNPHLQAFELSLRVTRITTSRNPSGADFKGGYVSYQRWKEEVRKLLEASHLVVITTMLDYYGLPSDFPGKSSGKAKSAREQVEQIEENFAQDINDRRFLPYLSLHEFEAILFTDPNEIAQAFPGAKAVTELRRIKKRFATPEEIDDRDPPSKRITSLLPAYRKTLYGAVIARAIGLPRIRAECPHFSQWVERLENLVEAK